MHMVGLLQLLGGSVAVFCRARIRDKIVALCNIGKLCDTSFYRCAIFMRMAIMFSQTNF